jgi:hypothetical protein
MKSFATFSLLVAAAVAAPQGIPSFAGASDALPTGSTGDLQAQISSLLAGSQATGGFADALSSLLASATANSGALQTGSVAPLGKRQGLSGLGLEGSNLGETLPSAAAAAATQSSSSTTTGSDSTGLGGLTGSGSGLPGLSGGSSGLSGLSGGSSALSGLSGLGSSSDGASSLSGLSGGRFELTWRVWQWKWSWRFELAGWRIWQRPQRPHVARRIW